MSEWGLMPDDINENWTEERFALMLRKRNERIRALNQPAEEKDKPVKYTRMTDTEFFAANGVTVGNV